MTTGAAATSRSVREFIAVATQNNTTPTKNTTCLVEQAKVLINEAPRENNLNGWTRWHTCSLCKQRYHGAVQYALGWACWKTYLGRPEPDRARRLAMSV